MMRLSFFKYFTEPVQFSLKKMPVNTHSFESHVFTTMNWFQMTKPGEKIVVGVSGGPDSVALFHVLNSLAPQMGFNFVVAHVNHNLRPQSLNDKNFVANLAAKHDKDFFCLDADVVAFAKEQHLSREEAGRRVRYSFFEELLTRLNAHKIATAHHVDDQIETFFLRLFQGTTSTGLKGIPAQRGAIIRPLIHAHRSQILQYLEDNNIECVTDETNFIPDTDRNFVRNVIMKSVSERFPNYRKTVLRTIELLIRDEDFMEQTARQFYFSSIFKMNDEIHIDLNKIAGLHESISSRVVRKALYDFIGPNVRLGQIHIEKVLELARSGHPSSSIDLPSQTCVRRNYDKLILAKSRQNLIRPYSYAISEPGVLRIAETGQALKFYLKNVSDDVRHVINDPDVACFDFDSVSFPLEVRSFIPGDRLEPWGMSGSTKIKKIFINKKIPVEARHRFPIVVKDDKILWVAGLRRSQFFGISPASRIILEIRLINPHQETALT